MLPTWWSTDRLHYCRILHWRHSGNCAAAAADAAPVLRRVCGCHCPIAIVTAECRFVTSCFTWFRVTDQCRSVVCWRSDELGWRETLLGGYWSHVVQLPASVLASLLRHYPAASATPPRHDTAYPHIIFMSAIHARISQLYLVERRYEGDRKSILLSARPKT